jgi:hypothetical protein
MFAWILDSISTIINRFGRLFQEKTAYVLLFAMDSDAIKAPIARLFTDHGLHSITGSDFTGRTMCLSKTATLMVVPADFAKSKIAPLWRHSFPSCGAIAFIADASNITLSNALLKSVLDQRELAALPLLVWAAPEVINQLHDVADRPRTKIIELFPTTDLQPGFDWLLSERENN